MGTDYNLEQILKMAFNIEALDRETPISNIFEHDWSAYVGLMDIAVKEDLSATMRLLQFGYTPLELFGINLKDPSKQGLFMTMAKLTCEYNFTAVKKGALELVADTDPMPGKIYFKAEKIGLWDPRDLSLQDMFLPWRQAFNDMEFISDTANETLLLGAQTAIHMLTPEQLDKFEEMFTAFEDGGIQIGQPLDRKSVEKLLGIVDMARVIRRHEALLGKDSPDLSSNHPHEPM